MWVPSPLWAPPPREHNPTLVAISFRPVGAPLVGALPPYARCHIIQPGHPSWAPSPLWPPPREHNPALVAIRPVGAPLVGALPPLCALVCTTQRSLHNPALIAIIVHARMGTPRGCPPPCALPPSWAPFCRRNVDTSPLALHRLERVLTKMPKASPTDGRQFLN